MKIVGIVQARMNSTRLPGKVLMDLAGEPMLARVVNRLRRATTLDKVVVATTTEQADLAITQLCTERGWPVFRGSQEDVLDRYYRTAQEYRADVVVRVSSDCPLIEPAVVDRVVREFLERQPMVHYASNGLPHRTFPLGLDAEVFTSVSLGRAWREDGNKQWREHVTPYLYRQPDLFTIHGVVNDIDYSALRWTVDTADDRELMVPIFNHFGHDCFNWLEVIAVLEQHPEWSALNRHVKQKVH